MIALIPKGENQEYFNDYKLINLDNVTYETLSKVLVSKMQPILNSIVHPFQNAFIKGRNIANNFLLVIKIVHFMQKCKGKKTFWSSLKVDIKKAYDTISWEFVSTILNCMEFPPLWITMIMQCVQMLTYKVLINRQTSSIIYPFKGLR